jgi:hypothetical protein
MKFYFAMLAISYTRSEEVKLNQPVGPKRCACPINGHIPCGDGMSLYAFFEAEQFNVILVQCELTFTKYLVLPAACRNIAMLTTELALTRLSCIRIQNTLYIIHT